LLAEKKNNTESTPASPEARPRAGREVTEDTERTLI
jgi:hypothetical protein